MKISHRFVNVSEPETLGRLMRSADSGLSEGQAADFK